MPAADNDRRLKETLRKKRDCTLSKGSLPSRVMIAFCIAPGFAIALGVATPSHAGELSIENAQVRLSDSSSAVIVQNISPPGHSGDPAGFHDAGNSGQPGPTGQPITWVGDVSTSYSFILMLTVAGTGGNGSNADGWGGFSSLSGGEGGEGGDGGAISLNLPATASVSGPVIAQSVAGQGGTDGAPSSDGNYGISPNGGVGAPVSVTVGGSITSASSAGVMALSIGGTGGNGSAGSLDPGVGGAGGDAGNGQAGGNVTVNITGSISAIFDDSSADPNYGVFAESIGGNGGTGGKALDADGDSGGIGGNAAAGGDVTVSLTGGVVNGDGATSSVSTSTTSVAGAPAIVAVSEGGVGGAGGGGGSGGAGGIGASGGPVNVSLSNGADVATAGLNSPGIMAESLGGVGAGGGTGGAWIGPEGGTGGAGGSGGDVDVDLLYLSTITTGSFTQPTANSDAIEALSIGGGGGSGGDASGGVLEVGGNGAVGADGGNVNVLLWGDTNSLATFGSRSAGILAQSIGGGGGNAGNATGVSIGVNLTIGGSGGGGGDGGTVNATSNGTIATDGDHSPGMLLQSIGGGGGKAGAAYGSSASGAFSEQMAVGGTGGTAGNGGAIGFYGSAITTNSGVIITAGSDSDGILGQSIGGGGGAGGGSAATAYALGAGDLPSLSVTASLGGNGGGGGNGNNVTIENDYGIIATNGAGSAGMVAQSIGGGGGTGGDSSATSIAAGADNPANVATTITMGGTGGTGGTGGIVSLTNDVGLIVTTGESADGMLAQSIGGGGGAGGAGDGVAKSYGGDNSLDVSIDLGGTCASSTTCNPGGNGGKVTVSNDNSYFDGAILTLGDGASGMTAQSIGGGGGRAGGAAGNAGAGSFSATVRLGGSGGSGGNGGVVVASNAGAILTFGADAAAIVAQSIGGGGGVGGKAASSIGSAKSTADGGNGAGTAGPAVAQLAAAGVRSLSNYLSAAGLVSLANTLLGNDAANSDVGSASDSDLEELSESGGDIENEGSASSLKATISIGGSGGSGGDADTVQVTNSGSIATTGKLSDGIVAQAIGGGGGKGGAATSSASGGTVNTSVSVGGSGGSGGDAGSAGSVPAVAVDNQAGASITTIGGAAVGILAQAVGGGGGEGGASGASTAILQGVSLALGGSGGASGDAYGATVTNEGAIETMSHDAAGIVAQSIGGGGGIIKTLATDQDAGGGSVTSGGSYQVGLTFGGAGGASGNSLAPLTVANSGSIATAGQNAYGIVAQSIGGGGGLVLGGQPAGSNFFGTGSMTGNGGAVGVDDSGTIVTQGAGAIGIIAQSIGGGGGFAGDTGLAVQRASFSPSGNLDGNGGQVSVTVDQGATVETNGSDAPGIFAQSVGGGGGHVTTSDYAYDGSAGGTGTGNSVTVDVGGTVSATGIGSPAIFAESTGQGGSGAAIAVTVGSSTNSTAIVSGGTDTSTGDGSGAGIYIVDGGASAAAGNSVDNYGTITSANGVTGTAIYSTGGYTTVTNESGGTITGAITLNGTGSCTGSADCSGQSDLADNKGNIINDGLIRSPSIDLGNGTLVNAGMLDVRAGGNGKVTLNGNYEATTGVLRIGADFAKGTADQLVVSGNVSLGPQSSVQVDVADWEKGSVPVLTAGGILTEDPPTAEASNAAYLFGLQTAQSGNTLKVQTVSNLGAAAAGASDNQQAVANNLDQIWNLGSGFSDATSTLATVSGPQSYQTALTSLTNEAVGGIIQAKRASSDVFTDAMISCGNAAQADGTACTWLKVTGSNTNLGASGGDEGYNQDAVIYQIGGQKEFIPGWFFGASLGYETSWLTASANDGQVSSQAGLAGLMIKHIMGPWTLTGVIDAGYGSYQSSRQITVGSVSGSASGSPDVIDTGLHLKAAYKMGLQQGWYINPSLSLSLLYLAMPSYSEDGPTAFNLNVQSSNDVVGGASPMFEIGRSEDISKLGQFSGYIGVGAAFYTGNDWSSQASFAEAPAGSDSFTVTSKIPDALAKVEAGLNLLSVHGVDVKLTYSAQLAPGFIAQALTGHFAYAF